MKVRVEANLCDAFGKCARIAPEIFHLDDEGYAETDPTADVPAELQAKVREALGACPTAAIILVEE